MIDIWVVSTSGLFWITLLWTIYVQMFVRTYKYVSVGCYQQSLKLMSYRVTESYIILWFKKKNHFMHFPLEKETKTIKSRLHSRWCSHRESITKTASLWPWRTHHLSEFHWNMRLQCPNRLRQGAFPCWWKLLSCQWNSVMGKCPCLSSSKMNPVPRCAFLHLKVPDTSALTK